MTQVMRGGRFVRITKEQAAEREARGLHVEWDEGVYYHYFPHYDPPEVKAADEAQQRNVEEIGDDYALISKW